MRPWRSPCPSFEEAAVLHPINDPGGYGQGNVRGPQREQVTEALGEGNEVKERAKVDVGREREGPVQGWVRNRLSRLDSVTDYAWYVHELERRRKCDECPQQPSQRFSMVSCVRHRVTLVAPRVSPCARHAKAGDDVWLHFLGCVRCP